MKNKNDYWFAAWFGPIGVAALYYVSVSYDKLLKPELWYIPALIIFSSVIVHGITSFPFIAKYSAAEKS